MAAATPQDRELTVRAVAVGCALGMVLAACNVYVGLKIGFYDAGAVVAAILGFALLSAFGRAPSSPETNVLVTASAAAAMMAGAGGLIGPVAAMAMLGHGFSAWAAIAWSISLAVLGVLVALPLRAPLVTGEGALPFPSGRATAEVITSIVGLRGAGAQRARAVLAGAGVSAAIAWFRDGRPPVIPPSIALPGRIGGHGFDTLSISIMVSPLLLSAGALIGARNGISLLVGAAIAWLGLAPVLADAGAVPSLAYPDVVSWLIWPGAALLIGSTLTSLALQWRTLGRGIRELRALTRGGSWLIAALAAASAASFGLAWLAFDVHPIAAALGVVLTPVLAAACVRSAGETDLPPVGPLGGVAQIAIAPLAPGNPIATLGGGAIVNGAAGQASQLAYAFRAGALVGSSPRALIAAQLCGIAAGALIVVPIYELLTRAHELGGAALPASAPLSWKATAVAVSGGVAALPPGAPLAAAIGLCAGVMLALLDATRARRYLPGAVGLGTAFLIPASYSITLFLGAAAFALARRRWPAALDDHGTAAAAGGIAGEALIGIAIALLAVLAFS